MPEARKQAMSLRVSAADLRKVKKLAQRLGVRDSDVVRFALKTMLERVAPLCDKGVRGRALLPVFIEAGQDLLHYFDLDKTQLEQIVNEGVAKDQEVEAKDLELIAMAGIHQTYAKLRLSKITPVHASEPLPPQADDAFNGNLRGYLYSKYGDVDRQ